jgi:GH15 family glucan-1,4-alpha-glucosidase
VSTRPISNYALLSDCRSAALVTSEGSVHWLCFPRFDSPALFARLLDEDAGHWSIHPAGAFESTRRYLSDTLVLETTYRSRNGTVVLVDALALGGHERRHWLGASSPGVLLSPWSASCPVTTLESRPPWRPSPPVCATHGI